MELGHLIQGDDVFAVVEGRKVFRRILVRDIRGVPGHEPGPGRGGKLLCRGIRAAFVERIGLCPGDLG